MIDRYLKYEANLFCDKSSDIKITIKPIGDTGKYCLLILNSQVDAVTEIIQATEIESIARDVVGSFSEIKLRHGVDVIKIQERLDAVP